MTNRPTTRMIVIVLGGHGRKTAHAVPEERMLWIIARI